MLPSRAVTLRGGLPAQHGLTSRASWLVRGTWAVSSSTSLNTLNPHNTLTQEGSEPSTHEPSTHLQEGLIIARPAVGLWPSEAV